MEEPVAFERLGIYVASKDIARSEGFYEAVFSQSPQIKIDGFIGFDIAGGLFAIVDHSRFAPKSTIGGNAIPYIKVSSIHEAFDHIKAVAPEAVRGVQIIEDGPIKLFKFTDPDGNVIEYYSLSAP